MPDPAEAVGTGAEKELAFAEVYRMLRNRNLAFTELALETLDGLILQARLRDIGQARDA